MRLSLSSLFIALCCQAMFAYAADKPSTEQVTAYLEASGITEMMETMPQQIDASAQQQMLTSTTPEDDQKAIQVMVDAWDAEAINKIIADHVTENLSKADVEALLAFRQQPYVVKITDAEAATSAPTFQADFMRYMAGLQSAPPSLETRKAIQRFVDTTEMPDMMLDMTISVTEAMVTGFAEADPEVGEQAQAALAEEFANMKSLMRANMEEQAILMSYFVYRDISNEDLGKYTDFYDTPLGKKEIALMSDTFNLAIGSWAKTSAMALADTVYKNR